MAAANREKQKCAEADDGHHDDVRQAEQYADGRPAFLLLYLIKYPMNVVVVYVWSFPRRLRKIKCLIILANKIWVIQIILSPHIDILHVERFELSG